MTTFTGSDSFPAAISGPDPGQTVTAARVVDGDTLLADRTIWLKNRITSRASLLERKIANSNVATGEDGIHGSIDMKAITSWTSLSGMTATTASEVAEGDLVRISGVLHVRHKRATAGMLNFRLQAEYEIGGLPIEASSIAAYQHVGDPGAASDLPWIPLHLEGSVVMIAGAGGTFTARLQAKASSGGDGGDDLLIASPWRLCVEIMRPVAAP